MLPIKSSVLYDFWCFFTFSLAFCALGLQSQQPHTIFCRCPHAHVLCVYLIYVLCSYCIFICKIYLQLSYYYQPTRSRHDTTILGVLSDFKYVMLGWRQLFDESHLLAVCCWPQIDVFFARVWFVWKIRLAAIRQLWRFACLIMWEIGDEEIFRLRIIVSSSNK